MTIAIQTANSLTEHAVCAAAGVRDGLRTAQFYVRDLSRADATDTSPDGAATLLSRMVAALARLADRVLNLGADVSVRVLVPKWRELPSPFAPGMRQEVLLAIRENRLVMTSLFTAYFFRAARHILDQAGATPYLVLEHRIDAARRRLVANGMADVDGTQEQALAKALLYLVEANAIAKTGPMPKGLSAGAGDDANLPVMATACLALLLAEDGKPIESLNEDEFFAITSALLSPRIAAIRQCLARRDVMALAGELKAVCDLY